MYPGHIRVHVGEVLGQRRPLVNVRVAPVEQVELCLAVLREKVHQVGRVGVSDYVLVPLLQTGMYLHRQPRLDGCPYYLVHHVVLQRLRLLP